MRVRSFHLRLVLCFIMPAFIIVAVMAIRKEGLGVLLTPTLFVLGFVLLFPVGLGEMIEPFCDLSMDMAGMGLFLGLSLLFLVLAVLNFRNLEISD